MAARIRNDTWKCDEELKRDLEGYVKQALKRDEVLDFVSKKNIQCMLGVCVLIVVVCITYYLLTESEVNTSRPRSEISL